MMLGSGADPLNEVLEMLDVDWAGHRLHKGGFWKGVRGEEAPSGRAQVVGAPRARGYRAMQRR
jgi:hypothetical protein